MGSMCVFATGAVWYFLSAREYYRAALCSMVGLGFWEYDADKARIAWATLEKAPAKLLTEIEQTEAFVRDQLGDARSFSLDSPDSRGPRIAALKKLG